MCTSGFQDLVMLCSLINLHTYVTTVQCRIHVHCMCCDQLITRVLDILHLSYCSSVLSSIFPLQFPYCSSVLLFSFLSFFLSLSSPSPLSLFCFLHSGLTPHELVLHLDVSVYYFFLQLYALFPLNLFSFFKSYCQNSTRAQVNAFQEFVTVSDGREGGRGEGYFRRGGRKRRGVLSKGKEEVRLHSPTLTIASSWPRSWSTIMMLLKYLCLLCQTRSLYATQLAYWSATLCLQQAVRRKNSRTWYSLKHPQTCMIDGLHFTPSHLQGGVVVLWPDNSPRVHSNVQSSKFLDLASSSLAGFWLLTFIDDACVVTASLSVYIQHFHSPSHIKHINMIIVTFLAEFL